MVFFCCSFQAALKRLEKNKVPNMAVLLKSIVHTHADARAVFKDPTGNWLHADVSCKRRRRSVLLFYTENELKR